MSDAGEDKTLVGIGVALAKRDIAKGWRLPAPPLLAPRKRAMNWCATQERAI